MPELPVGKDDQDGTIEDPFEDGAESAVAYVSVRPV